MNNRLKELAKQAGIWFEDTKDIRTHSVSTTTLEKFAGLVVQECVWIVDNDGTSEDISEHFGVNK